MRKLLALAPALLLAGCHSEQVALRSQVAASEAIALAAPTIALDSTLTATVLAARPAKVDVTSASSPAKQRVVQPVQRPPQAVALRPLAKLAAAGVVMPAAKRLAHRLQRQRPTEGAAESGLGRVALFFIGVVLAVLAGLAALVSLIPGISFWGALGLVSAGLVVLFLLYSLFSGGKKKK